jgi:hypothetical protein
VTDSGISFFRNALNPIADFLCSADVLAPFGTGFGPFRRPLTTNIASKPVTNQQMGVTVAWQVAGEFEGVRWLVAFLEISCSTELKWQFFEYPGIIYAIAATDFKCAISILESLNSQSIAL